MSTTVRDEPDRFGPETVDARLIAEASRTQHDGDKANHPAGEIVWGKSKEMRALCDRVERAAASDAAVLLTGETGTGKGEVAQLIHRLSRRRSGRLVHVDCAALAPQVIESELFGHERGAFTGAAARRPGRFELAEEGTLFLDEVAELAPELQAKLLRVLHDRCFERVGGGVTLAMRARVVAATNRPLNSEVAQGRFRSDLYYRLAVLEFELPPLRERSEDLSALMEGIRRDLSARLGRVVKPATWGAREVLARHSWPGNVRELVNLIERVAIYWPERPFDRDIALEALASTGRAAVNPPLLDPWDEATLRGALEQSQGNVSRAARMLDIPRSTLRYRLRRSGSSQEKTASELAVSGEGGRQLELPLAEIAPGRREVPG
jgi:DNA-binding NtrC family response regulator